MTQPFVTAEPTLEPAASPAAQWQATFNAALGGACSNPTLQHLGFEALHEFAERCANRAHGTLNPPSTFEVRQSPEVQALVEAAQRLHGAYTALQITSSFDAFMGPLGNALAPFQTPEPTPP